MSDSAFPHLSRAMEPMPIICCLDDSRARVRASGGWHIALTSSSQNSSMSERQTRSTPTTFSTEACPPPQDKNACKRTGRALNGRRIRVARTHKVKLTPPLSASLCLSEAHSRKHWATAGPDGPHSPPRSHGSTAAGAAGVAAQACEHKTAQSFANSCGNRFHRPSTRRSTAELLNARLM